MKDTPENKVKKQIQDLLRADGWFVQSNPQFGPFVSPGRPDMEAYKAGRIIRGKTKRCTETLPAPGRTVRTIHFSAQRGGY